MGDRDKIAKTIYNEARGEGKSGMDAVGETIQNRHDMDRKYMGGKDYSKIADKAYEGARGSDPNPKNSQDKQSLDYAQNVADRVISHNMGNTTQGATHFDANRDSFSKYESSGKLSHTTDIGHHHFFKEK